MSDARAERRSLLTIAVILCVAYLPLFAGKIVFFRDPALWNYPARWFARASILRGEFPHWNPDQGLGFSVWANPLYGLFYPPNWLFLLVPESLVASMLTWQSFAHLLWGSVGVALLARALGAVPIGMTVAGLVWGLSGYTTSNWSAGLLLLGGAWVPWCGLGMLSLWRALERGDRGWRPAVAKAALPIGAAILMGEVFVALMGLGFALLTTGAVAWLDRTAGAPLVQRPVRAAALVTLALSLGVGLGALNVLPARAIAAATVRGAPLSRDVAERCSLHPFRLVEFVAPGAMGYPHHAHYPAGKWVGEPGLDHLPLTYAVYLGASAVALALLAFDRRRRLVWLLAVLALAVVVLALGRHTPVHGLFRTIARPFAYMRYPEKYLVLTVAWLSLLAGLGATRLAAGGAPWRRLLVFAALLGLVTAAAPLLFPAELVDGIRGAGLTGLVGVFGVSAALYLHRTRPRASLAILVGTVAVDLAAAAWPLQEFGSASVATTVVPAARALLVDHGNAVGAPRLYRAYKVDGSVGRFVPALTSVDGQLRSMQTLIHNTVTTFGIATLPGYDAAIPARLSSLWGSGQKVGQSVLRLLGIRYAVLPIDDPADPVERRVGLEKLMDPVPGARLYRVPGTLPRVYLAGRAEVVDDDLALARLFDPDVVGGAVALLGAEAGAQPLSGTTERAGNCTLTSFSNARITARCRADRPSVAVFIEQHDRGWQARLDGQPVPLWRANLLMRAVPVPAGDHEIVLSYNPPAVPAAAAMSVGALLALVGLLLTGRRPLRAGAENRHGA